MIERARSIGQVLRHSRHVYDMGVMTFRLPAVLLAPLACASLFGAGLEIYWIDVEGGAATLIVTAEKETVLMDAGWPGFDNRDPQRIIEVLEHEVGRKELDYFIVSHFHRDHVGGVEALASMIPIHRFVDHGDSVEVGWNERADALWASYVEAAGDRRMQVEPGDRLPLKNTDFLFVAARSRLLRHPLVELGPNSACRDAAARPIDRGENGKSVGFLVRVGKFEFLDLGDLTWNFEIETACPANLFGEIDLYQVTHHGMHTSGAPAHIEGIRPLVAVMNNGPRKGGSPATYQALTSSPSLLDLWQVHRAVESGPEHNPSAEFIANLGETEGCNAHWIRAVVEPDGRFTVTNSRLGFSKEYVPR